MTNRQDRRHPKVRGWQLTSWRVNGKGGWTQQPVITIEGETPFFADHPQAYIDKLGEMSKDSTLARGAFHAAAGAFQDALEQSWNVK